MQFKDGEKPENTNLFSNETAKATSRIDVKKITILSSPSWTAEAGVVSDAVLALSTVQARVAFTLITTIELAMWSHRADRAVTPSVTKKNDKSHEWKLLKITLKTELACLQKPYNVVEAYLKMTCADFLLSIQIIPELLKHSTPIKPKLLSMKTFGFKKILL